MENNILKSLDILMWKKIEPLTEGWSNDKKYILTAQNNMKYVLRISDISLYEKKRQQFLLLKEVQKLNLCCSQPISFGIFNENQVYMILSYVEGYDARNWLSTVDDNIAYQLGKEAGQILWKLHQIEIEVPQETWWEKYQKKIGVILNSQREVRHQDLLIQYVKKHMFLVQKRCQTFQHGDYHNGNMIVYQNKIGIIDFDKNGIGDPYADFKPFCWNVLASEYFETGLINGYFHNQVPEDFFPILALYAAESLLTHLPWAIMQGEEEVEIAYQVMDAVMKWYDNFNLVIPTWYKGIPDEEKMK